MLQHATDGDRGQVTDDAARIYAREFVPALFARWAPITVDAAGVSRGDRVLDVACGTGVVTVEAASRAGTTGAVVGLDPNEGMLAVARERDDIDWREGIAEALPFDDGIFDAVTCQFGLMFFDDKPAGLSEMRRVAKPGGRAVATVWESADTSDGWGPMIALLDRLFGPAPGDVLRVPFSLGDRDVLTRLLAAGGWEGASVTHRAARTTFDSIGHWVHVQLRGWALSDLIDEDGERTLAKAAEETFAHLVQPDGSVAFAAHAHVVELVRPSRASGDG